jgi:hypothetical protein
MSYDPFEHRPSAGQIVAAWLICLGIAGLALAFTAEREAPAAAVSGQPVAVRAGDPGRYPMAGVRIPDAHPVPAEPKPLLGNRFRVSPWHGAAYLGHDQRNDTG